MTSSRRTSALTIRFDRVRLDMLEEAVQVCRAMFTGDENPGSPRRDNDET
jgi:hypothetical protein